MEKSLHDLVRHAAAAHGVTAHVRYERRYPALINHARETELAAQVAADLVGEDRVNRDTMPAMASEDSPSCCR